jgi:hypothetical protein
VKAGIRERLGAQQRGRSESPREARLEGVQLLDHGGRAERIEIAERPATEGGESNSEDGADIAITG